MAETKQINTRTTLNVVGTVITIFTQYLDLLPLTISAFIAEIVATENGTPYIEGDLVITMIETPQNIDYNLDSSGNLIVNADGTEDASKYSIDSNGDLIYTF